MANKISVDRGTTHTISGTYLESGVATDITGATVYFTVKSTEYDSDATDTSALIKKNVSSFTSPTRGLYVITLTPTDTYIDPGNYYYSVKIKLASGAVYKLDEGRFLVDGDSTNRSTS